MEVMIAMLVLTSVGVSLTFLATKNQQTITNMHQLDRSKLLADMVFEQYSSYSNAATLSVYDQLTPVPPKTLLNTTDNMGFDGYTLTTQATYSSGSLASNVLVTVYAPSGKARKFNRSYNVRTGSLQGTTVDVWVVAPPCDTTAPASCTGLGLSGFEVTADSCAIPNFVNSRGTTEVIGYTRSDGHAALRNVMAKTGVIIRVHKPGSPVFGSGTSFSQGYYVVNTSFSIINRTVDLTQAGPNVIVFDQFRPLGTIQGNLTNTSAGPVNNMLVVLAGVASTGSGLKMNARWNVVTDAAGHYTFFNVLPGSLTLWAAGDPGSHYDVTPADVDLFRYGYSNASPYSVSLAVPAQATTVPTASQDVSVTRLGWLYLRVVSNPGGALGGIVETRIPATLFHRANPLTITVPATGIALFNIFDVDGTTMSFTSASQTPRRFDNLTTQVRRDTENQVTVRSVAPYALTGTIIDAATGLGASGYIIQTRLVPSGSIGATSTAADGTFTINYFPPLTTGATYFTDYFLAKGADCGGRATSSQPHSVSGKITDMTTGLPVHGQYLVALNSKALLPWQVSVYEYTAADGSFTFPPVDGGNYWQLFKIRCPAGGPCQADYTGGVLPAIDRTLCGSFVTANPIMTAGLNSPFMSIGHTGDLYHAGDDVANVAVTYPNNRCVLPIRIVDAATGTGLKGIKVCDADIRDIDNTSCGITGTNASPADQTMVFPASVNGVCSYYVPNNQLADNGASYGGSGVQTYNISDENTWNVANMITIPIGQIQGGI